MCPRRRSDAYKAAGRAIKLYRKRRRRIMYGPYECPICGQVLLIIRVKNDQKAVVANCPCGFGRTLDYSPPLEPVDYYNKIIDSLHPKSK